MQNRIRELRDEKRMTQLRLSTELGVTQETISSYERNRHYPSVKSLLIMAQLFNSSMDYIMGISDVRLPGKDYMSGNYMELDEVRILELYRKLSEIQRGTVLGFMQGMIGES